MRTTPGARGVHAATLEALVERITDRVLHEFEPGAARDPHIGAEVLLAGPDRIGCLPFGSSADDPRPELCVAVAQLIDHTLLRPDATGRDIERLCEEADRHGFKSVCVNPVHVRHAARLLERSPVLVCAVVGFPLGATLADVKAYETKRAVVDEGAREIDMVLPVGHLRAGHHGHVAHDILEVVRAAGPDIPVKVILETCLLRDEEKRIACRLALQSGAAFVKTSTGFSTGGATAPDVRLMREEVGSGLGVKASGGIRSMADAVDMIRAGANRLGASASVAIVSGASR